MASEKKEKFDIGDLAPLDLENIIIWGEREIVRHSEDSKQRFQFLGLMEHLLSLQRGTFKYVDDMKRQVDESKQLDEKGRLSVLMDLNSYPFSTEYTRNKIQDRFHRSFVGKASEVKAAEKGRQQVRLGDKVAVRPSWGK